MVLPSDSEAFWNDLQAARADVLKEVEGLSQAQLNWRPHEKDWSVGEIIHHLTVAEIATGKLTTKLLRDAEAEGTLRPRGQQPPAFDPVRPSAPGPFEAPPHIWPERGRPKDQLLADMKTARERSRQSFERVAAVDPRPLVWRHVLFGDLHLGQYWAIMLGHDRDHTGQIRAVKAGPGFPKS